MSFAARLSQEGTLSAGSKIGLYATNNYFYFFIISTLIIMSINHLAIKC